MNTVIESFGRTNTGKLRSSVLADDAERFFQPGKFQPNGFLPYGNGRSYGDSCLTAVGTHIDMRSKNKIISFDQSTGVVIAEPGLILGDLIVKLHGTGWFPPVVPGTQFVTLGGALANDIHGKNHHAKGTFGAHVVSFFLARSDGTVVNCSRNENAELFAATIGGFGLTGVVTQLTMQLAKVNAHAVLQQTIPFSSLDGYFDLIGNEAEAHEYAVAWLDQLAAGKKFGRGLMLLGDHAEKELTSARGLQLSVPFQPPINLLNGLSLKLFNEAYNWAGKHKIGLQTVAANVFFFPLDAVKNWNRLYGPNGLFQHQSVLPLENAREIIPAMLRATHDAGEASFLTVLKKFGEVKSPGLLSFPRSGHTLTLDFPNRGRRTLALLNRLDAMVLEAGGAVNPYKDARMSAKMFKASFTNWEQLEALRDPAIVSDFWTRTALSL
ncbi:MAG: FAD-binding protein [Notoacmeibacter sp.]